MSAPVKFRPRGEIEAICWSGELTDLVDLVPWARSHGAKKVRTVDTVSGTVLCVDGVALMPPHTAYVEPFGGGLSVLLAKPPSMVETVNDLDQSLMTFWRVLRERPDELERVIALTPHSRAEFHAARDLDVDDDLEKARRVWTQLAQGRGSRLGVRIGWKFTHGGNGMSIGRYLDGYLARIAPAAERLRYVALESRDALDCIRLYERPEALIYADPPYPASVRNNTQYACEMLDDASHEALLTVLIASPAAVMISGYDCELYSDYLTGWHVHRMRACAMTGEQRTEVIWTNFNPADHLHLDLEGTA